MEMETSCLVMAMHTLDTTLRINSMELESAAILMQEVTWVIGTKTKEMVLEFVN